MKYRHEFHAGNFADVHKHVALLALLRALGRKEKGFLYLETHAGRGTYVLPPETSGPDRPERAGVARFLASAPRAEELVEYLARVAAHREEVRNPRAYPGSPLLAARELRPQDRAVLAEIVPDEARVLERALAGRSGVRIERADGFAVLRASLPPRERRGLVLVDPPYEDPGDFERVREAIADALRRFRTGVLAAWYPIKHERDASRWLTSVASRVDAAILVTELWLYPRDSRVSLNGSGLLIVNPPHLVEERMRVWLPELRRALDARGTGGESVRLLGAP